MIIKVSSIFKLLFIGVIIGCSKTSPKPIGYIRFDPEPVRYDSLSTISQVKFEKNSRSKIISHNSLYHNESFVLNYGDINAIMLCSFICFEQDQFFQYSEESRNLVYQHTAVATEIVENSFSSPERNLYGKIYDLSGPVATPIQFELTDSTSRFFRGSLMFNCTPNQDSLKPYVRYIREDILHMIQTFYWQHHK